MHVDGKNCPGFKGNVLSFGIKKKEEKGILLNLKDAQYNVMVEDKNILTFP